MKDLTGVLDATENATPVPTCPLTGSALHRGLRLPMDWRRGSDPRQWDIWWNADESYGQVWPRPSAGEVSTFYEVESYYTHSGRGLPSSVADRHRNTGLARLIGSLAWRFEHGAEPTSDWWRSVIPAEAQNGLEIGCGNGDRMLTIAPHVKRLVGVEPDPMAVRAARASGLDVLAGTAEDLPDEVRARRYDAIVFAHVLEHTLDPVLALANARELLSERGIMSVEVPNNACEGARMMGPRWRWLDVPRHLNFFTPDSLKTCAEAAGLKVQAVLYRGYVRQFMPDWIHDEARITAELERRPMTRADIRRQVRHSARLLARTALAAPARKYDSVRVICTRD